MERRKAGWKVGRKEEEKESTKDRRRVGRKEGN